MRCTYNIYYQLLKRNSNSVYHLNYFVIPEKRFIKNYKKIISLFKDTIYVSEKFQYLNFGNADIIFIDIDTIASWNNSYVIYNNDFIFSSSEYNENYPTIIKII